MHGSRNVIRRWGGYLQQSDRSQLAGEFLTAIQSTDPVQRLPASISQSIWNEVARTADRYDEPGHFTAFAGYEWPR